jgi:hypothetical protein
MFFLFGTFAVQRFRKHHKTGLNVDFCVEDVSTSSPLTIPGLHFYRDFLPVFFFGPAAGFASGGTAGCTVSHNSRPTSSAAWST